MDRFQTNNIYTVNQSGQYLTQKNFSDPKQIRRFYAMLVGADARDGTNFSAAKAFPNSPFAVLDGMSRRFSVQEDCSHPFYEGVTAYDGAHREFCREFLQMTPLSVPSQELLPLYEAYAALHRFAEGGSAADCAAGVQGIIRFQVRVTPYLNRLYETVRSRFSAMLCEDAVSGLSVLHWLEITADALGDSRAIPELHKTVCGVMIREGYLHPADSAVHALFDAVCRMTEAKKTAKSFVSVQMAEQFSKQMLAYSPAEWDAFTELFFACAETAQGMERAAGEAVLLLCAASSYRNKNGQKLVETAKKFTARRCISVRETLLDEAERTADRKYAHFLVQALVYAMPEQVSSGEKLNKLYNDLELRCRAECFSAALLLKAETVTDPSKIAAFLTAVCTNEAFQELELAPVFQALDRNLRIGDADAAKAAGRIQTAKPRTLKCIQSAHIYALTVLDGKYTGEKLDKVLKGLAAQGFPCAEEDTYADELIRLVMRPSVPDSTFRLMTEAAARSGYYCQKLTDALFADGSRQSYERLALLTEAAAAMNSAAYADALTRRCSRLKRMSRQIAEIRSRLTTDTARDYLAEIEAAAEKLAAQNAQPSLLQKLFGKGTE